VADVDTLEVKVFSSEQTTPPVPEKSLGLVDSLLESVIEMTRCLNCSSPSQPNNAEFVLLHIEDRLQEFFTKAVSLNQLKNKQTTQLDDATIIKLIDIQDERDLEFLNRILSVAVS
jgi:hypothetical protein